MIIGSQNMFVLRLSELTGVKSSTEPTLKYLTTSYQEIACLRLMLLWYSAPVRGRVSDPKQLNRSLTVSAAIATHILRIPRERSP
jgi:hypothetical protein